MMVDTPPAKVLAYARTVLAGEHAALRPHAPRAAATLARQALEDLVHHLCPGLRGATMRSRLISLEYSDDLGIAGRTKNAWTRLSNACHYHAYELGPSAIEVQELIDDVDEIIAKVGVTATFPSLQG